MGFYFSQQTDISSVLTNQATAQADLTTIKNDTTKATIISAKKTMSAINAANSQLFTISGGAIRLITLIGYVTTTIQTSANNCKLRFNPDGGSAIDLSGNLDVTGITVKNFITLTGVKSDALVKSTDLGILITTNPILNLKLGIGVISLVPAGNTSGVIDWYIEYQALSPTSLVTPA